MNTSNAMFGEFQVKSPDDKVPAQPPPPENVPVLIRCAALTKHEVEGMLTKARGRSGLRWQLFNMPGYTNRVSYPHRGWQPDCWRYKHSGLAP